MEELAILALLLTKGMEFTQVMMRAKAEGRDLSADEIQAFRDSLMDSDADLQAAIEKAKSEGR